MQEDGKWRISKSDIIACTVLVILCLCVRLATAWHIENNGDAIYKWLHVKKFIGGEGLPYWDQHTLRWALMLPVVVIQYVLGTGPHIYYVFPIIMACLGSVIAYCLGCVVHSRTAGWLCALGMVFYPGMIRNGAQYLPCGPETAWILLALLILFVWQNNYKTRYLAFSAAVLFLGYGSKITALYYVPGILLWLIFFHKNRRAAAVYLSTLAGLFLLETLAFYKVSGNSLGRIGILAGSHHMKCAGEGLYDGLWTFWQWLFSWTDYLEFHSYAYIPMFATLAVIACVFIIRKKSLYLLSLAYLSGFIFHTWTFILSSPFAPPQPHLERYLLAMQILGFIICIIFFVSTPIRISIAKVDSQSAADTSFLQFKRINHMIPVLVVLFFACYTFCEWRNNDASNSIAGVIADNEHLNQAIENGEAFAVVDSSPIRIHWCLNCISSMYYRLNEDPLAVYDLKNVK